MQFNLEEDTLYSPLSPDVIEIQGNSENEVLAEPGNVSQMEETFRNNLATQDAMTTFVVSATAMLFPSGHFPR